MLHNMLLTRFTSVLAGYLFRSLRCSQIAYDLPNEIIDMIDELFTINVFCSNRGYLQLQTAIHDLNNKYVMYV